MAKVVHLTSVHDPFDTRIFLKQCRSLRAAGHQVVLVAAHDQDRVVDGIRIRAVPLPANRLRRFTMTTVRAAIAAWQEAGAIVHIHDPELLPAGQLLRLTGRRVIFDMHENVPKDLRTKDWIPPALRRLVAGAYRGLERMLLHGIPVVLAESSYERDYRWLSDRTTVLNLPLVDELLSLRTMRAEQPTVGYMGLVSPQRGSRVTVEALARLEREGLAVHWECVGRISAACRAAAEQALGARAKVHGPLPSREGWRIMARCHVGLAVLGTIPNHVESYPTKLFEYMALGVPVVASDFPLYREVVEDVGCGLCVDPEDPVAVAEAVRWLLEHPAEAAAMGERGRAAVGSRFNWTSEASKLLALYDRLLERGSHARRPAVGAASAAA